MGPLLFLRPYLLGYAGTTLKIPVRITSADHNPAPLQTIPWDFSHSPGVARITGTATTSAKDTNIRRRTNTWTIPTMRSLKSFNVWYKILKLLYYKHKICKNNSLNVIL